MKIYEIDSNFAQDTQDAAEYYDVLKSPFKTYGLMFDQSAGYHRMPVDVANAVSAGVSGHNLNTSGGRLRFSTDSDFLTVKCSYKYKAVLNHMAQTGVSGFSVYLGGRFAKLIMPPYADAEGGYLSTAVFGNNNKKDVTLYFPLYNQISRLYIGVNEKAYIKKGGSYKYQKPVLFYGSSITQGACASRPGLSYDAVLCRMLDTDYINLGFSGSCRAEDNMCDYISKVDCSVFVYDYDHNAPDPDFLKQTHFKFYSKYREKRQNTPIIMMSRPNTDANLKDSALRRDIILQTYNKGKESGDNNLYFIDGHTLFGQLNRDGCTVDGCHPTDLGFERMAETVYPLLKSLLK